MGSEALELAAETKERLAELRKLSARAEEGDKAARQELRRVLRESGPAVVAEATDLARFTERVTVDTIAGGKPLMEEGLPLRLEAMRREIAGPDATPLELLLAERIAALWVVVHLADGMLITALGGKGPASGGGTYRVVFRLQESIHRRYLSAIQDLARVRKLQSATPGVQVNAQINVLGDGPR